MADIMELAKDWRNLPTSFEGREVLRDGDEVWVGDTLELGLPIVWLKHPNDTFVSYVIHTPGYDQSIGEHWCFNCHCQMNHRDNVWECPKCEETFEDDDLFLDDNTAPSEEASYRDEDERPEEEWFDNYYDNPHIPHHEDDFEGF